MGRAVARSRSLSFVDTDGMFGPGVSAAELLREIGEAAFRERELEVLVRAVATRGIVSTGGGAVTTEAGRRLLKAQRCVWLRVDPSKLVSRVGRGDRPLLGENPAQRLAELAALRDGFYDEVALRTIDANQSKRHVVEALAAIVEEWAACE